MTTSQVALSETLPGLEVLHAFLIQQYKHDRFQGRDIPAWGGDYSWRLARSYLAELQRYGCAFISHHETSSNKPFYFFFNGQFVELTTDAAREIMRKQATQKGSTSADVE